MPCTCSVYPEAAAKPFSDYTVTVQFLIIVNLAPSIWSITMAWTKPTFNDLRFGMEITMYILNR
jgi:coenzyme PQQ precursor peptide PqqA